MNTFIPAVSSDGSISSPDPALPPREIDPRLIDRGVTVDEEAAAPGMS